MSNKTINQALKDLFLGLGGNPSALSDNTSVSDYIEDLESAIKGAASGAQIDDTTASESTVYSSSKTESLIPTVPEIDDTTASESSLYSSSKVESLVGGVNKVSVYTGTIAGDTVTLSDNKKISDIKNDINNGKFVVIFAGFAIFNLAFMNSSRIVFQSLDVSGNPATFEILGMVAETNSTGNTLTTYSKTLS